MIVLELLLFLGLGLAALVALGSWARYLLPHEWRSYTVVLAPLVGYTLLLLVGYYAVRTVLNLPAALLLALVLALVLTGLLFWREKRAPAAASRSPRGRPHRAGLREHAPALLLALSAILLAVLPLLSYGYSAPIGENWDPENYMPLTAYLQRVPVSRIVEMPPNPLRDLNAFPPRIGMTLGFCILQGALGALPGVGDALATFAPTIALLYGLTTLAWYALFRIGFGLGRWAGTIAAAPAGLSALALWVAFFNFGMQLAAMPLVPLALTLWLLVLRRPSWRTVGLAGLAVAAVPVAYYPALTVFVPVALGLGLYEVALGGRLRRPGAQAGEAAAQEPHSGLRAPGRAHLLVAGLATAALSVALAVGPVLDYGQGFSFRYGQQMTTLGLFHFPTLAQFLGLAPFSRTPEALPPLWAGLAAVTPWLVVAAAGAALLFCRSRWLWLAALVPALFYLAWLRGSFLPLAEALRLPAHVAERLRPYHYAFLKGAVFVVPFFWGAAVTSGERAWEWLAKRPAGRAAVVGLLLLPLGLLLAADAQLVARYWGRPANFDAEMVRVAEAARLIPPGEEVYLTGRPERARVTLGLFAYLLREHPVQGRFNTGYSGYDRRLPGAEPNYALLDAADNPVALGFFPADAIWAGGGMVLYRRAPEIVSFLDLRDDAYAGRSPGEIHTRAPLTERLLHSFGLYPLISFTGDAPAGPPLTLYADAARLGRVAGPAGETGTRALLIAFAAGEPVTVTLAWADGTSEACVLPAGFSTCRSQARPFPAAVQVTAAPGASVWACWAALVQEGRPAGVELWPEVLLLWPAVDANDGTLQVVLPGYGDERRPLGLGLEVWENTYSDAQRYAWWGPLALPLPGPALLRIDLGRREAHALVGEQELAFPAHPGADGWPAATDGTYFVALGVYYGGPAVEVVPVGRFVVAGGQVQGLTPVQPGLRLFQPRSPTERSGAYFGTAIALEAYQVPSRTFLPGDEVPLALEWRALAGMPVNYAVSAQLLQAGRLVAQWDGPAGQWYPTAAWRPGQLVRDDIPLRLPVDVRPGRYRLIVVVYDPATGARLPVRAAGGADMGDYLELGEINVR